MINKWCFSAVSISAKSLIVKSRRSSPPTHRRETVTTIRVEAGKSLTRMEVYWRALNNAWARLGRSQKFLPRRLKSIRTLHPLSSSKAPRVSKKVKHRSFTWRAPRIQSGQPRASAAIKSAKTCSMSLKTRWGAIKIIQIRLSLRRTRTKSSLLSLRWQLCTKLSIEGKLCNN